MKFIIETKDQVNFTENQGETVGGNIQVELVSEVESDSFILLEFLGLGYTYLSMDEAKNMALVLKKLVEDQHANIKLIG